MTTNHYPGRIGSSLIVAALFTAVPTAHAVDVIPLGPHAVSPVSSDTVYTFKCNGSSDAIVRYGRMVGEPMSLKKLEVHGIDYANHPRLTEAIATRPIQDAFATCLPQVTVVNLTTYDESKDGDLESRISSHAVQIDVSGSITVTSN